MRLFFLLTFIILTFLFKTSYAQQDMDLHISGTFLSGKNIVKVRRNIYDPYLWVLAQNNQVYRINSLTRNVDDYTAHFSAYNNFQFVDIVGVNKDSVYLATNSSNIVAYTSGVSSLIGASDGIIGMVNGIGVNPLRSPGQGYFFSDYEMLLISTDRGLFRYNYKTGIIVPPPAEKKSRVFESSYHSLIFHGTDYCRCYPDPQIEKRDLLSLTYRTIFAGDIYLGNDFGTTITSAYSNRKNYYNQNNGSYEDMGPANQFWATEKGLFQNDAYSSSEVSRGYKHYLDNKNINKITAIYGLLNFGGHYGHGNDAVKENLLIGTSKGLYYSNSQYFKFTQANYSFFHFSPLGNVEVNDISVNADSYKFNPGELWFNTHNVCEDGFWIATANGLYFLTRDYKPYISPDFKLKAIWVDNQPVDGEEIDICQNVNIQAQMFYVQYQNLTIKWYKNGQLINGATANKLDINSAGDYHAMLTDPCSNITLETRHLKVNVISTPVLTFNYPDKINQCQGTSTTLQVNSNNNYSYRWYKNGVLNGNFTAILNTSESGKYKVEVSSCSGNWVSTKEVEVNFVAVPIPSLAKDKTAYCIGQVATLSTSFVNDGNYTINWFRDGNVLGAEQNKTSITTTLPGTYTVKLNSSLIACDNSSAPVTLAFESMPIIYLERIITTTLCDGQSVDIRATYSNGTLKWNTGATSDKITVNQSGTYTATIKTAAGCEVSENLTVQFVPNPTLNISDVTLCQFINESITLTAPSGFARYEWNGQVGEASFSTSRLGAINLKVTDSNGCTATQIINVTSQCDEIHVPNTFTPNNDGYNDTWKIEGLEGDPTITVRVFNRAGEMVFRSVGYPTPWNGTYNGKKLAAGTYYYIINAKQGGQTLNGTVTMIN